MALLSLVVALFLLALVPVAYAFSGRRVVARFGRAALPILLVVFSMAVSMLGAWRMSSVTPAGAAYRPFETNPVWMVSLYAGFLAIALIPTTIRLGRASTSTFPTGQQALREIPWFLLGLLLALLVILTLDITGVPFLPPPTLGAPPGTA